MGIPIYIVYVHNRECETTRKRIREGKSWIGEHIKEKGRERKRKKAHVGRGVPQQQVAATWRGWCRPPSGPSRCFPCRTPCFALRVPAGRRWRRRRNEATRRQHARGVAGISKNEACDIAFVRGIRANRQRPEIDTHICRNGESLLTPAGGTGIPCEFSMSEISRRTHSVATATR